VKYHVCCLLCKSVIRDTRDIHEAYTGGVCMKCVFFKLLSAAKMAQNTLDVIWEEHNLRSVNTDESLKAAIEQAEKVRQ